MRNLHFALVNSDINLASAVITHSFTKCRIEKATWNCLFRNNSHSATHLKMVANEWTQIYVATHQVTKIVFIFNICWKRYSSECTEASLAMALVNESTGTTNWNMVRLVKLGDTRSEAGRMRTDVVPCTWCRRGWHQKIRWERRRWSSRCCPTWSPRHREPSRSSCWEP